MTPHPTHYRSCEPINPCARLNQVSRLLLLFLVILTGFNPVQAALHQTIGVNVMSPEVFRIGRKEYPISEMTSVVAGQIRGEDRVRVKIFLPLGIKKEIVDEIKDRCRKAGAKSFFIVYKS